MYNFWINSFNPKHLKLDMEERGVDCPDDIGVEEFVYDEKNSERSWWKFCNSTTLPSSDFLFFQAAILLILIISSLAKLLL